MADEKTLLSATVSSKVFSHFWVCRISMTGTMHFWDREGTICLRFRMIKLLENYKTENSSSSLLVQGGYDHKYGQCKQNQADRTG